MKHTLKKSLALMLSVLIIAASSAIGISAESAAHDAEITSHEAKNATRAAENATRAAENATRAVNFPSGAAGVNLSFEGRSVLHGETAIINSVTYVPLRNFVNLAGSYDISWNAWTKTATVKNGSLTVTLPEGKRYIEAHDRCFYTVTPILNIDGSLYVPIRPLCIALGLDLAWNGATRTVELWRGAPMQNATYNADDLYWLSRIINAEAGAESMNGKMAVGNVVLNRVRHKSYPNSIWGVIFDRKYGTQFTPAATGTIYKTPNADSIRAAKMCLEGYSLSNEALFFINPRIATNFWIVNTRKYCFSIGNHDFYK